MGRLITGHVAVTGTAAPLIANREQKVETLVIRAHGDNNTDVYMGDSTVTTSGETTGGYPLSPGEEFSFVPTHPNLQTTPLPADVYVIGTSGARVSWVATPR